MRLVIIARTLATGIAAIGGVAIAAPAAGPTLIALARIETGQWTIRPAGSEGAGRAICLTDQAALIQYEHPGMACQRFTITDEVDTAIVHYTCSGVGHGQTTIKVVTPRSFTLATQGIASGQPFDDDFEARRVGACTPGTPPLR